LRRRKLQSLPRLRKLYNPFILKFFGSALRLKSRAFLKLNKKFNFPFVKSCLLSSSKNCLTPKRLSSVFKLFISRLFFNQIGFFRYGLFKMWPSMQIKRNIGFSPRYLKRVVSLFKKKFLKETRNNMILKEWNNHQIYKKLSSTNKSINTSYLMNLLPQSERDKILAKLLLRKVIKKTRYKQALRVRFYPAGSRLRGSKFLIGKRKTTRNFRQMVRLLKINSKNFFGNLQPFECLNWVKKYKVKKVSMLGHMILRPSYLSSGML